VSSLAGLYLMKILVISLAGIGDTLLATPLIHELRVNFPTAAIDALVMWAGSRDILETNPHVHTVYHKNLLRDGKLSAIQFLLSLRPQRYDVSINTYPQSKLEYRLGAFLIQAKQRLSHTYGNTTSLDRWLVTHTLPQDYDRHSVENNLALLQLIGAKPQLPEHRTNLFLSEREKLWAKQTLEATGLSGRKLLGIHVGSGKTKNLELRRWPLDCYLDLIRQLTAAEPEAAVLLFGGPEEQADHEQILQQTSNPQVRVAPSKSLRQAAALIQLCRAFLSVDTALMHVAAAVEVPRQVVIETPTFNKTIEPFRRSYELVPNPAVAGRNLDYYRYDGRGIKGTAAELERCMRSVIVPTVLERVRAALA
jgi:ADP-heptose:LPS heptosyltransferase